MGFFCCAARGIMSLSAQPAQVDRLWGRYAAGGTMAGHDRSYRFGIEEELQLVDAATGQLCSESLAVLPRVRHDGDGSVEVELYQAQIEIGTPICDTLGEARAALTRMRRAVAEAAVPSGARVAAAGTHPFSHWREQRITPKPRYHNLAMDNRRLVAEEVVFGCHVHVGLPDREDAVQVMNRARLWLAPLLAVAGNSPFWIGQDTGYASYRSELWRRWPMSGTPQWFDSGAEYDAVIKTLVATGVIRDPTKIYWDVRPSERYATLEFRIADVQLTVDEAVMVAGLTRALARTCHEQALSGDREPVPRGELLLTAKWLAARDGVSGQLLDPDTLQPTPARVVVDRFLRLLRPALEAHGDWEEVSALVERTLRRGTGAARQRAAFARAGRIEDVMELILAETAA
jgi:glutamate---cysteine ligase / carboxylate-amine ligase